MAGCCGDAMTIPEKIDIVSVFPLFYGSVSICTVRK